ncbi:MAG: single-stranded-DNA-specific exonuclease RecJ [Bdellovibrionota bacterium]
MPHALAHVLVSRGLDTRDKVESFLDLSLTRMISPFDLSYMEEACQVIVAAIKDNQKILIHGDFDADGITASALFSLFFEKIGYPVDVYIPNRLQENHGISRVAVEKAIHEKYGLLITCDCGSHCHGPISELIQNGVRVIVTDHHHVGDPLPDGALLINPQQNRNQSHMEELAGVGVVFLTIMALRKKLREIAFFQDVVEPNLKSFVDIVALGTIADLAPIWGMNRILVAQGLEVMQRQPQIGIDALKMAGGLTDTVSVNSLDVGFKIAPKINAAARLGYADQAFALLTCQDQDQAHLISQRLLQYNKERQSKQEKMFSQAYPEAARQVEAGHHVLVVASESFHPGIIGLLAQKISQVFARPVFAFALEGEMARGSARSPEGYHLVQLMDEVSALLGAYGGHAQAGGCSVAVRDLQEFTSLLQDAFRKQFAGQPRVEKWVDSTLDLTELNTLFFEKLDVLRPFGKGYPYPVFETEAEIVGKAFEVGQNHLKCKVKDRNGRILDGIAFDQYSAWKDQLRGNRCLVVQPQLQYFRGAAQISLQLLDFA